DFAFVAVAGFAGGAEREQLQRVRFAVVPGVEIAAVVVVFQRKLGGRAEVGGLPVGGAAVIGQFVAGPDFVGPFAVDPDVEGSFDVFEGVDVRRPEDRDRRGPFFRHHDAGAVFGDVVDEAFEIGAVALDRGELHGARFQVVVVDRCR